MGEQPGKALGRRRCSIPTPRIPQATWAAWPMWRWLDLERRWAATKATSPPPARRPPRTMNRHDTRTIRPGRSNPAWQRLATATETDAEIKDRLIVLDRGRPPRLCGLEDTMANTAPSRRCRKIIEEFRANTGRVGRPWAGITPDPRPPHRPADPGSTRRRLLPIERPLRDLGRQRRIASPLTLVLQPQGLPQDKAEVGTRRSRYWRRSSTTPPAPRCGRGTVNDIQLDDAQSKTRATRFGCSC